MAIPKGKMGAQWGNTEPEWVPSQGDPGITLQPSLLFSVSVSVDCSMTLIYLTVNMHLKVCTYQNHDFLVGELSQNQNNKAAHVWFIGKPGQVPE